jgi:AcrR family transcriptional regulator
MTAQSVSRSDKRPPPPRRRRLDGAARRATIVQAAIPVFATVGYEQARMSDIAARVGVTEPVIFQNFGTKAEVFAAALEQVSRQAITHLSELVQNCAGVEEFLRALLSTGHLEHLHTAPMFGVLFEDAHRLHFERGVRDALQRALARVADALTAILARGQAEGSIRTDVDARSLAWLVVSLIQARQFRRMFSPEQSQVLEDDLLNHVVAAISSESSWRGRRRQRHVGNS